MNKPVLLTAAFVVSSSLATGVLAQPVVEEVMMVEISEFADGEVREAQILDANYDERTLTVRFESDEEMAELIVPESAEIMLNSPPSDIEREIELTQLNPGDEIEIQAINVEGVLNLRIVGFAS